MKKFVTIFFLFSISIQCLPVKEMGECLFKNSFVEEEFSKKAAEKKSGIDEVKEILAAHIIEIPALEAVSFPRITTALHDSPPADVTTPPPNA